MSQNSSTTAADQDTATVLRRELVDQLCEEGHIVSSAVEEAFRSVPRHHFVPNASLRDAYANNTVHVKHSDAGTSISCASQPSIVALQLEQLDTRPGQRILELGTGTGYNAALVAHLVGDGGRVTTIDVDQDLVRDARARLEHAGIGNVEVVCGDGALGNPDGAPYDRIIATVGCHDVPRAWLAQLAPGGRLVAPVRIAGDVSRSIVFEANGDHWVSTDSQLCTFVPLRGGVGDDPRRVVDLTADGSVTVQVNRDQRMSPDQVRGVLAESRCEMWTGVLFGRYQSLDPMWLWLALDLDNAVSRMPVQKRAVTSGLVTPMLPWGCMASVPTGGRGLAYLTMRPIEGDSPLYEVGVVGHTEAGQALAERMAQKVTDWESYRSQAITFALHPEGSQAPRPAPGRFVLERSNARLVVTWGSQV